MLFYRVETAEGKGPYRCTADWYTYEEEDIMREDRVWPMPSEDCALSDYWLSLDYGEEKAHIFGFRDLDQLKAWFYKRSMREALHERGYRVSYYSGVGHYGDSQAVFRKDSALFMGSFDLLDI